MTPNQRQDTCAEVRLGVERWQGREGGQQCLGSTPLLKQGFLSPPRALAGVCAGAPKGRARPGRGGAPVLTPGMGPGSAKGPLLLAPFLSWQSERIPDALCHEDSDCPPGKPVVAGNGEAWGTERIGGSSFLPCPSLPCRRETWGAEGVLEVPAFSLSLPCRSEKWPLPAGGERAEGHV